jgi:hypothetical protein
MILGIATSFLLVASTLLFQSSNAFPSSDTFTCRSLVRPPPLSAETTPFQEAMREPYSVATLLLGTLLERRSQDADFSFDALTSRLIPSYKLMRENQQARIESLIKDLTKFDNTYDPVESLLGPLYLSLYWYTPNVPEAADPLWERVSLKEGNIKGQQYFLTRDFSEGVINYSEIWGPSFHIRAKGAFAPISESEKSRKSFFDKMRSERKVDERLRSCPDVYQVNATGVSLNILGWSIQLPIEGSSSLVVLYADPRIRVFVSPLESQSVVGNWEEAGLVVVQVRSDLVIGENPVDLR